MTSLDKLLLDANTNDEFIRTLMSSLVLSTRASNEVPTGNEFSYCSTFANFANSSEDCADSAAKLLRDICDYVQPGKSTELPDDLLDPSLYSHIVDVIDKLLETADLRMDQVAGKGDKFTKSIQLSMAVDKERLMQSNVVQMEKPQLRFLSDIDNSRERPFRPRIKVKYHAVAALDLTAHRSVSQSDSADDVVTASEFFAHPYETELKRLKYQEWQLSDPSAVIPVNPVVANRPFHFIDCEEDLDELVLSLKKEGVREIGLDLEHHAFRSFQGLTCLMQLSTREEDYVIDTLLLRSRMHVLGDAFADPTIVKILHGSESDVLWLQKDFGLYLVNTFDTFHAAKILKYPALSLAHLLKFYGHIKLNKKHQLSDWRQRPLPQQMIDYARTDTVYLHFLYDCMRKDVFQAYGREGLETVYNASRKWCLQRYEKEQFWALGFRKLMSSEGCLPQKATGNTNSNTGGNTNNSGAGSGNGSGSVVHTTPGKEINNNNNNNTSSANNNNSTSKETNSTSTNTNTSTYSSSSRGNKKNAPPILSAEQDLVLAALWNWRDITARVEDESPHYIMSNAELVRFGFNPPSTLLQLNECEPLSEYVRSRAAEILDLINRQLQVKPTKVDVTGGKDGHITDPTRAPLTPSASLKTQGQGKGYREGEEGGRGEGVSQSRLYGRSLQTPCKDLPGYQEDGEREKEREREKGRENVGSHVYTFTPAMGDAGGVGAPRLHGSVSPVLMGAAGKPSPVLDAEDIFRLAGWSSPSITGGGTWAGQVGSHVSSGDGRNQSSPFSILPKNSSLTGSKERSSNMVSVGGAVSSANQKKVQSTLAAMASRETQGAGQAKSRTSGQGDLGSDSRIGSGLGSGSQSMEEWRTDGDSRGQLEKNTSDSHENVLRDETVEEGDDRDNSNLDCVPQTYEQIYEISNRNRGRNKEKKRLRDEDDDDADTPSGGVTKANSKSDVFKAVQNSHGNTVRSSSVKKGVDAMGERLFDENLYFASGETDRDKDKDRERERENRPTASDTEAVLDFAESVGWVAAADRAAMREGHLQDVSAHADAHPEGETHTHTHALPSTTSASVAGTSTTSVTASLSTSMSSDPSLPKIKGSHSPPRKISGSGPGSTSNVPTRGQPAKNSQLNKSFDYSRVSGGLAAVGMSGTTGTASGSGGGAGGGTGVVGSGGGVGNSYDSATSTGSGGGRSGGTGPGAATGAGRGVGSGAVRRDSQGRPQALPGSGPTQGQGQFNPYLQQPPSGGAGTGQGAGQGVGRGSGTSHFNLQVERRSGDRSLIYTNNNSGGSGAGGGGKGAQNKK